VKTVAILYNTFKETARQPAVIVLVVASALLIVVSSKIPLFLERKEELRMIADMGLATMAVCGLLIALLSSSSAIADEIEQKTALTVLSKPVRKSEFILGKYLGIMLTVLVAVAAVWLVLVLVSFSVTEEVVRETVFYAESSVPEARMHLTQMRLDYLRALSQGTLLTYLQLGVLTAISVAISTHLPMVVNVVGCFFLFVLGHMSPWLYTFFTERGFAARAIARFFYAIIPNLENFNVASTLARGESVAGSYILFSILYGAAYSLAALIVAVLLFERRELA